MVMRHAGLDWYKPSFKTPAYPTVPILGLLGCLFVMGITSRPTILIGLAIVAGTLIWYVLFLRGQTQLVGASNVLWQQKVIEPLVARAEDYRASRREAFPVILLPLSNPETRGSLLTIGMALASVRRASLHLLHVVSVPTQTPLEAGRMEFEQTRRERETILDVASRHVAAQGIRTRSHALVAHNVPSAILGVADIEEPDLLLMGWNDQIRASRTRGANVAGVVKGANRNVLVLKDNGLNQINRILVPTAGGPHARLGMRVAQDLATQCGATVTAMTVQVGRGYPAARSEFDQESLHFFQDLAEEYSRGALKDAGVTAETSTVIDTDVGDAIVKASVDYDLVIIGASNEWRLRQWLFGSLPDRVTNHSSASVLMVRSGA
jgi:nucleotide-binding universal stress UspA family protein